jgi:uncharacterized lipoprotein YmbA
MNRTTARAAWLAVSLGLLTGCLGGTALPEPADYLLRVPAGAVAPPRGAPAFALGDVRVAAYLEQPGIVLAQDDGVVRAARYHRWAEPLDASVRLLVAELAGAALGRPVARSAAGAGPGPVVVDLTVDTLHGTADGRARIDAHWRVAGRPGEGRVTATEALAEPGYPALVAAEYRLLERLAEALAAELRAGGSAE